MTRVDARMARFGDGDFSGADLTGARFEGAFLGRTQWSRAKLDDVTFRLSVLHESLLEHVVAEGVSFISADLHKALLSGSRIRGADFQGATLTQTGLAEIDWEGSNLRDADFARASSHYGSSRSGLVNSVIAGEGSKTGFYTDEYTELGFKAPEEIRKANLCGADLRGAKVERCDWYLVDLRGAQYDEAQARHFARCGAILRSRA